jgi:hypothetical protein
MTNVLKAIIFDDIRIIGSNAPFAAHESVAAGCAVRS